METRTELGTENGRRKMISIRNQEITDKDRHTRAHIEAAMRFAGEREMSNTLLHQLRSNFGDHWDYAWEEINACLFINMSWSAVRIVKMFCAINHIA